MRVGFQIYFEIELTDLLMRVYRESLTAPSDRSFSHNSNKNPPRTTGISTEGKSIDFVVKIIFT